MMFEQNRFLCPTDFSESSRGALPLAVALASRYRGRLTVLHVVDEESGAGSTALPEIPSIRAVCDQWARQMKGGVGGVRTAIGSGFKLTKSIVRAPRPSTGILRVTRRNPVDLIIMATRRRLGLSRLLGSGRIDKVLRKAEPDLLLVSHSKGICVDPSTGKLQVRRILVPIDFSSASIAAARKACRVGRDTGATVTLAHVVANKASWTVAETSMKALKRQVAQFEANVQFDIVEGKPAVTIAHLVRSRRPDLVFMCTSNAEDGLAWKVGPITSRTIQSSACPVWVVREPRTKRGIRATIDDAARSTVDD